MDLTINEVKNLAKDVGDDKIVQSLQIVELWYAEQKDLDRTIKKKYITRFICESAGNRKVVKEVAGELTNDAIATTIRALEQKHGKGNIFAVYAEQFRLE